MVTKAIIWDMDGVISDTQHLHATIEAELLERFGIIMTPEEITNKYAGVRTADFFTDLLTKKGVTNFNVDKLMAEKWVGASNSVKEVKAIPGVTKLLKEASKRGILQAVASASGQVYVNAVLNQLGIKNYFKAIITGDQVSKGKPDPEIFLKAAQAINVNPQECIVIEDGRSGMIGAKKANMKCIGLVYDKSDYPADFKVDNLNKLTLDFILSI